MSSNPALALPRVVPADRLVGVGCGVGAGALWGLVFLAPQLVRDFSPVQLTLGRYLAYGLIALACVAPRARSVWQRVQRRQWWQLAGLAAVGNTLYYLLLAAAVQTGGIALASLVMGFLPLVVTVIGSRDAGAVPLRRLLPSLACGLGGAVCIGWQAWAQPVAGGAAGGVWGLVCAVAALASWTAYAVGNARALRDLGALTPHEWNLLIGLVTGAQALVLVPWALPAGGAEAALHTAADWGRLAAVSVGVAVLASMLGNALWNRMSQLLPLTLVGQMILFETFFALLYGWLWEQRWPTGLEAAALVLVVASVTTCLRAHPAPGHAA